MKILIHSNGPHVPSGYGKQARHAGLILRDLGHEVAFSCLSGLGGQPIRWEGYTLFPAGALNFSPDTIVPHALTFGADAIIPLMDFWKLEPAAAQLRQVAADPGIVTAPLIISDCQAENGGPGIPDQRTLAKSGAYPVAVSQFGKARLEACGIQGVGYLPHVVDTNVYRPLEDKQALREELGAGGEFLIGIMAANRDLVRKGFPEQFAAFKRFSARHPDARLAMFTVPDGPGGVNLAEMAGDMGILDKTIFMPAYEQIAGLLPEEFMAKWYATLDVLSLCSYAEGFGVPLIEAQACGIPVVATDGSAMSEHARHAGWLVKGQRFWNPQHRAWWIRPDEDGIVKAWEKAYRARGETWRSEACRKFALGYSYEHVRDTYWVPFLEKLEQFSGVLKDAPTGTVTYDGLKWKSAHLTEQFGDSLALAHESDYDHEILGRLGQGKVFVDVGAHVGHWTVRAAAKGAKVIAVEADPITAARLRENLDLNDLDATVLNVAAWDETTELHLNRQHDYDYDGTNQVRPDGNGELVIAKPLDELLCDFRRIDLIKVDVEGADMHVLRGMAKTVARLRPALFIEDHSVYGYFDRAELDALLTEWNYSWRDLPHGYLVATPEL